MQHCLRLALPLTTSVVLGSRDNVADSIGPLIHPVCRPSVKCLQLFRLYQSIAGGPRPYREMTESNLRLECLSFCRVGQPLDNKAMARVEQVVEALKAHLQSKVAMFLEKHRHHPVLVSYASDATPLLVTSTSSMSSLSMGTTRRSGRTLIEFLMQSTFYKAKNALGDMEMTDFLPPLRHRGHKGICVQHMSADRLVFGSLDRHLRGRQVAYYDPRHGPDHGPEAPMLQNTDWMLSTPCAVHDAHNGLKWGLSSLSDGSTLEDLHILIESIRNSFAALREHIPQFLHRRLRFHDPHQAGTDADRMVWALLGLEPQWVEEVVSLNPSWMDGWLFINVHDDQQQTPVEQISQ